MDYNEIQKKLDQISGEDKIIGIKKLNDEVLAQAVGGLSEQTKETLKEIFNSCLFVTIMGIAAGYLIGHILYSDSYKYNYLKAHTYSRPCLIPILDELKQNGEITSYSLSNPIYSLTGKIKSQDRRVI